MKTYELFEQEGWQQIVVRVTVLTGETLTKEHADHIVKRAVEQADGHYIKPVDTSISLSHMHQYYYPEFSSDEGAKQLFKIFRRMSRAKPRFQFVVNDLRATSAGNDYEIYIQEL